MVDGKLKLGEYFARDDADGALAGYAELTSAPHSQPLSNRATEAHDNLPRLAIT